MLFRLTLSLASNGPYSFLNLVRVSMKVLTRRFQLVVQLVHLGYSCGKIDFNDFFVRESFQVLYQSSERVAMSRNKYFLTSLKLRHDCRFPIWQHAFQNVFEAFTSWHFFGG